MDEMRMLRTLLAEHDPSRDVMDRSRHRLQRTMRGPVRRRRVGWLAPGLGLTAAAATATVVIASAVTAPPPATPNSPPAEARMSGRQILLASAATAESRSATTGTYWHIKSVMESPDGKIRLTTGTWTRRDGLTWISAEPGKISKLPQRQPITVPGTDIGLDQVQRLPTDPDKLTTTLVNHLTHSDLRKDLRPFILLMSLLNGVPAPPKVRAAAFRALASLPHVKNLGKVNGGYNLVFSSGDVGTQLIVDPKTTTVSTKGLTTVRRGTQSTGTVTHTSKWTNQLPPYQVVPMSRQKKHVIDCHAEGSDLTCTHTARR